MRLRVGGDGKLHGGLLGFGEQPAHFLFVPVGDKDPNVYDLSIRVSRIPVNDGAAE